MVQQHGQWELPPDPHHIGAVRRQVASFAARAGMPATALTDLQVAVSDAITNAVIHAEGERDTSRVCVAAEELGDELVVRVREDGRQPAAWPDCVGLGPRLSMIAALAQVFRGRRCEGGATELSMHFALGRR